MQISVSKKMGDATFSFSIEGSDLKDCLFKSAFLMDKDEVWGAGMESC